MATMYEALYVDFDAFQHESSVLPDQFFSLSVETPECPEKALMRAVLEDAILCFRRHPVYQKTGKVNRRLYRLAREAEEWIFSNKDDWPYSFVNICRVLEIDPGYIRLGLKRWQATHPLAKRYKHHVVRSGARLAA